ncbi:Fe-S cluster assembly sulfur transfer protein SufU [Streptococcus parauberis]|uniref:SUF system FeS assembly protein n=1 Tax=Streptococcus parauberis KRS-02083 TaxID=1207545 RepID=A0ABN0IPE2_9STRE|nr:SUF system NifU family Fe-S cluster assembly protein [Streptococcus parauberis]AUT05358.1 Iron-sulfur cluster assembly scaffold protein IscU [Streptococcus parauberis]EMG24749.1 SUF system FeS assembly protein [Streptococcus parauberis KRS-02083]UWV10809.1 SUF system NifU family Fe-S cluster assembly protein [Streptococcus parauberis]WEM60976.1 SUF system NifU family Fe-S cluster assembly protein [Streptococcus parauberis]WOF47358.1 SUF system NifU family Fe-S cluster assembly protein [Stre
MALSKLNSLYMAVVADHSKSPHHRGILEGVEAVLLNNPTCGDVISLTVDFDGEIIKNIAFAGDGCTISTASSSMMTDAVIGKTKDQALELAQLFSEMVQGKENPNQELLGEAELLAGVAKFPQRIKCSTLAWHALEKAIERSRQN